MKPNTNEQRVIRFSVSNVAPATFALPTVKTKLALEKLTHKTLESCCDYSADVVPVEYHPLIAAAHLSFQDHRPLVLSPDILWLAIVQGIAIHINRNSEKLRREFVQHEGKEKITVRRDDFLRGSPENPWAEVFTLFSSEIKVRIGSQHDVFVETFSTTGAVERAAFEVALMDAMQSYFNFEFSTLCGIPEITLEGTTEDWQKIGDKLSIMEKLGLKFWTSKLGPIVAQFVRASKGDVDPDFWLSLYKVNDESGGPYINGWIAHFLPYVADGESESGTMALVENPALSVRDESFHGIALNQLPSGLSKVPFVWNYLGKNFDYEFLGGFIGVNQGVQDFSLRPKIGWAVRPVSIGR